jgi:RNA polymerase sigma-70 factor, ECF subfamily
MEILSRPHSPATVPRWLSWRNRHGADHEALDSTADASPAATAHHASRACFMRLVEPLLQPLYHQCFRILRNAADAEDALQSTLLKAMQAYPTWNGPFRPWIFVIARHEAFDLRERRDNRNLPLPNYEHVHLWQDSHDERIAMQTDVGEAIAALPDNYRQTVELFYIRNLTWREVATELGIDYQLVRKWHERALARLHDHLENTR